jgi:carboxylesterase 2
MQYIFHLLPVAAFLARVACAPFSQAATALANPTVTIASGIVIGTARVVASGASQSTATVHNYLGIPFAAAPTGTGRFAPPATPTAWSSPLEATTFSSACIQQFICKYLRIVAMPANFLDPEATSEFLEEIFNNPGGPPPPESEDCLYLNVFAPAEASSCNQKAVLFWIYGVCSLFDSIFWTFAK